MNESEMRRAIARKRDGGALEPGVWQGFVAGFLGGEIDSAQAAALLMACVLRDMTLAETRALTEAFIASGETLVAPDPRTVDKHSSGGVADTASLIVVPLVAACGVPVAKLSGRALGHTGGTLDKLEAIEGVRVDLTPAAFFACVRETGCAIAAQSDLLVPADKRIYALRDRTATVPARGLIAASIVSKKIAGGAHSIVYDVKVGRGAFLTREDEARGLADMLVELTRAFGRRATALVTDMEEPLGPAIGTGLEVIEAREFLRGSHRDARLAGVCSALGAALLRSAGDAREPYAMLEAALESGRAYETFSRMLAFQGAAGGALERLAPHAQRTIVTARRDGYVAAVDPVALGECARELVARGGGGAGLRLAVRRGEAVAAGAPLATVYGDATLAGAVAAAFVLDDAAPPARPLVYVEIGDARSGVGGAAGAPGGAERSTLESR